MAMNPERVRMLEENADRPFEPSPTPLDAKTIRLTGANLLASKLDSDIENGSLGTTLSKPKPQQEPNDQKSRSIPPKRPHDGAVVKLIKVKRSRHNDTRENWRVPPLFPPAPPSNQHTTYLTGLLRSWPLQLVLEPAETKKSSPSAVMDHRVVTEVGLVITENILQHSNLPILRLPSVEEAEKAITESRCSIARVARGELLEDV
ncbi:hypothetical protein EsDP_00005903 [Epichloe bromicola]|uniref:Uncharacterized protein n=1 Tax=Epichloe bromicola TaxID=79588 RepID=A0ABQ0CW45_9HYPO